MPSPGSSAPGLPNAQFTDAGVHQMPAYIYGKRDPPEPQRELCILPKVLTANLLPTCGQLTLCSYSYHVTLGNISYSGHLWYRATPSLQEDLASPIPRFRSAASPTNSTQQLCAFDLENLNTLKLPLRQQLQHCSLCTKL